MRELLTASKLRIEGSLLPKLLDKPSGIFLKETFSNGRAFSRALCPVILVPVPGSACSGSTGGTGSPGFPKP